MRYLHTMIRVQDLEASLNFFCNLLGLVELNRKESTTGRFTLVFLSSPEDLERAREYRSPLLELTYNWPAEAAEAEQYEGGRNFGHLAYLVDDIYATCKKLQEAGLPINRPPRDGHMAFVKSPDGISIELLQKGAALEAAEPWISMPNIGTW